mgnify:CR=1 FL=1
MNTANTNMSNGINENKSRANIGRRFPKLPVNRACSLRNNMAKAIDKTDKPSHGYSKSAVAWVSANCEGRMAQTAMITVSTSHMPSKTQANPILCLPITCLPFKSILALLPSETLWALVMQPLSSLLRCLNQHCTDTRSNLPNQSLLHHDEADQWQAACKGLQAA